MKQLWSYATIALLLIFISSCGSEKSEDLDNKLEIEQTNEPSSTLSKSDLSLLPISFSDTKQYAKVSGRVIPLHTTQLNAEVQGRVVEGGINFKTGVAFSKGDILLVLDDREYRLGLEAQRAAFFNSLTALMPDMKSDYADSYPDWLDYIQKYKTGMALPSLPVPRSNKEKYYLTSYQIYNQYYNIKASEERLAKYKIIAPYSGMITSTMIDVGSLVSPGQPLATIISRFNYELEAGLNISNSQDLKVGDVLTFTSNSMPGYWTGTVVRKTNILDPATQNIPVFFRLKGKNITSGMFLESRFQSGELKDVVILPLSVIKRDNTVLVLDGNVIKNKQIEPIDVMTDSIAVKGLATSDVVILNDFQTPVIGRKVSQ